MPSAYATLVNNTYLWEPLRYHGLYELGELPAGQLSCVGFIQTNLQELALPSNHGVETVGALRAMIVTFLRDHSPASPDVLVLPELMLPGPCDGSPDEIITHFQQGAIAIEGAEVKALVELANEFQISLVLGIAEREQERGNEPHYYNTVLLLDPEGVYGVYRKLHLTTSDRLWASPGNRGLPVFDTPSGRIGLATGYDVLFPETLRVLAGNGADLVAPPLY